MQNSQLYQRAGMYVAGEFAMYEKELRTGKEGWYAQENRPTQRAPDWRESVAFSGFFYTQAESCSQAESTLRPPAGNARRWPVKRKNLHDYSGGDKGRTFPVIVGPTRTK